MSENESNKSEKEIFYEATQWKLIWWKFRKHAMAKFAMYFLLVFYFVAIFCEFFSPYSSTYRIEGFLDTQPSKIHIF